MAPPQKSYHYDALPRGSDEIRLLHVAQQNGSAHFDHELVRCSLETAPAFEAASYVWGNPKRVARLSLTDGTVLPITKSVQDLLPFLSQHCSTGYLWIDQISINQDDMKERVHQVKMMGDIYRKSTRVLVWLGEVQPLHPGLCEIDRRISAKAEELESTGWSLKVADYVSVFHDFIRKDDGHWTAISPLLRRNWFQRAWIVQEVFLASSASAIFGDELVPIANLLRLLRIFLRAYQEYRSEDLHYRAIEELYEGYLSHKNEHHAVPFYQLLRNLGGVFQATDKRDHVLAFLGLKDEGEIDIEPDYVEDATAVHVAATREIIKGSGILSILRTVRQDSLPLRKKGTLPSWVPNWRAEPQRWALYIPGYREVPLRQPNACQGRRHVWIDASSPACLIVKGKIVDTVSALSGIRTHDPRWRMEDLHRYLDIDGKLAALRSRWPSTFGHPPDATRLLRTALADSARENDVPLDAARFPGMNIRNYDALLQTYHDCKAIPLDRFEPTATLQQAYLRALQALADVAIEKVVFVTAKGKLGLACDVVEGDVIAVLHGCDTPVLLRPTGKVGSFEVVEVVYLEDAMMGEAVVWAEKEADEVCLV